MKKILLSAAVLAMTFVACDKDESTDTSTSSSTSGTTSTSTPTQKGNFVTAKVNGVDFVSKDDVLFETYKIQFGSHYLAGKKDDTEAIGITFWFMDPVPIGTYSFTDETTNTVQASYLTVNPHDTYTAQAKTKASGATGSVTVTSSDGKTMTGTFEYTAVNTKGDKIVVTDGKFSLSTN